MTHDITEWNLMVGLVLEQLPTHKEFMSPWWMENKMVNIVKCIKEIFVNGGDENGFKNYKER